MTIKIKLSNYKVPVQRTNKLYDLINDEMLEYFPQGVTDRFKLVLWLEHKQLNFDSIEEFRKEFKVEDLNGLAMYSLQIAFLTDPKNYNSIDFEVHGAALSGVEVSIMDTGSRLSRDQIEKFLQKIQNIYPECKVINFDPEQDQDLKKKRISNNLVNILERFPDFQLRQKTTFHNEKDFQDFLFPILKSHYSDLKYEESMPQFAGSQTKPDFIVPVGKVLIEAKFAKQTSDFKKFRKEISDDINTYLINSDYERVIVIIYNSNNSPIPDNYKEDLGKIPGIYKVIITPGIAINLP